MTDRASEDDLVEALTKIAETGEDSRCNATLNPFHAATIRQAITRLRSKASAATLLNDDTRAALSPSIRED